MTPYYSDATTTLYFGDWREHPTEAIEAHPAFLRTDRGVASGVVGVSWYVSAHGMPARYGCPPGGTVLDLFAGSCSTGVAAKLTGRKSVLWEVREEQCEQAARRLQQDALPFGGAA